MMTPSDISEPLVDTLVHLKKLSKGARLRILRMSNKANSAHAGSALSCVEILISLFHRRFEQTGLLDKIILSKGHAAMALYATAEQYNQIEVHHLENYLRDGSKLWGHPSKTSGFSWIDWSTGSLGHGLPAAVGLAYHRKILCLDLNANRYKNAIAVVLSDGECNEGSNWEAFLFAAHHKLSNLVVFIDYNKIQSLDHVNNVLRIEPLAEKLKSFNWDCIEIDGHNESELLHVWEREDLKLEKPLCVICHTIKGKGVPALEGTVLSHYRPISTEQIEDFCNAK